MNISEILQNDTLVYSIEIAIQTSAMHKYFAASASVQIQCFDGL